MKNNGRKAIGKVLDVVGALGALASFLLIIVLAFGASYGGRFGLPLSLVDMIFLLLGLMVLSIVSLKIAEHLDPDLYSDSYEYPSDFDRLDF